MEKQDVMGGNMDMTATQKAEVGKTYQGKIVSFQPNSVIQAVMSGNKTSYIEHERLALSGAKSGVLMQGKDLTIRYPFSGVGIVKETALERKVPELQHKGLGGAGRF